MCVCVSHIYWEGGDKHRKIALPRALITLLHCRISTTNYLVLTQILSPEQL